MGLKNLSENKQFSLLQLSPMAVTFGRECI
jgi:hypothetical protein